MRMREFRTTMIVYHISERYLEGNAVLGTTGLIDSAARILFTPTIVALFVKTRKRLFLR